MKQPTKKQIENLLEIQPQGEHITDDGTTQEPKRLKEQLPF